MRFIYLFIQLPFATPHEGEQTDKITFKAFIIPLGGVHLKYNTQIVKSVKGQSMEQGRYPMEKTADGNVKGGSPLHKPQHRSHIRKPLKEEVETPERQRVFQPRATAKTPSKEAVGLKPGPFRNKVKDMEEHVLLVMVLQTFIRTLCLLSEMGSQREVLS